MKYLSFCIFTLFALGCSAPVEPVFERLENVKFNSITLVKPYSITLNADAVFYNPNVLGANITEMDFDVYLNGNKATHIRQDLKASMSPKSEFALPIECKVPLKEVFKDIKLKDLYQLKEFDYKLDGHFKLGLGGIEVKIPVIHEGHESLLK